MKRLLTRIFGVPEEINGANRCPTYLYRWHILKTRWFKAYLHHFVGDDWSLDQHDHPKRFITIGLWGGYVESTPKRQTWFRAPWIRSFPAEHIHRITMTRNSDGSTNHCWTFVVVLKNVRQWGFWHLGQFVPWREYVDSETADEMKACD